MTESSFKKAETSFRKLIEEYPDSKLRIDAEIGLADALFSQKKFDDAAFQYQHFIELYPASRYIDKAYYYKGLSYFKQKKSIDRDQSYIYNALESFEYIINNYPESKFLPEVKKDIKTGNNSLAKNLLYIGKFYYRIGAFHSAIRRLLNFIDQYEDYKFSEEAYYYLVKAYMKRENILMARKYFKRLNKKYPKSRFSKRVKHLVESTVFE